MPEPTIPAEAAMFEAHQFIAFSSRSRDYGELRFVANGGNAVHVRMDYSLLEELTIALVDIVPVKKHVKPRMVCPVCDRDVVKRGDDKPTVHYPPAGRKDLTCGGAISDHCRGGCKCRRPHDA